MALGRTVQDDETEARVEDADARKTKRLRVLAYFNPMRRVFGGLCPNESDMSEMLGRM